MNRKGPHLIILVGFKTNHIPQHFTTKLLLQYDYYNWGHLDKVDQRLQENKNTLWES